MHPHPKDAARRVSWRRGTGVLRCLLLGARRWRASPVPCRHRTRPGPVPAPRGPTPPTGAQTRRPAPRMRSLTSTRHSLAQIPTNITVSSAFHWHDAARCWRADYIASTYAGAASFSPPGAWALSTTHPMLQASRWSTRIGRLGFPRHRPRPATRTSLSAIFWERVIFSAASTARQRDHHRQRACDRSAIAPRPAVGNRHHELQSQRLGDGFF